MRPTTIGIGLGLGVLVGLVVPGPSLRGAGTDDPGAACERARGLLDAGLLAEARKALSTSPAAAACHGEVLGELAKRYRLRGEAQLEAGATDEARASFLTSLEIQPRGNRAKIELRRLHRSADPFDAARHLLEVGDLSAARKAARDLVEKDPSLALPADLQALYAGRWQGWWKVRQWALGWLPTVLEILLVVLGMVLLGVAVRRLLRRRVIFEAFESQVADAPAGTGLARLVQSHLIDLSGGGSDPSTPLIRAEAEAIQFPEVAGKISPLAGPLVGALNALLALVSRPPYKISGHTHRAGPRGLGLTLQLSVGERILQSVSLWQSDFTRTAAHHDSAASLYLLTEMGAVWVLFQLKELTGPDEPFRYLGSRSWRAVAQFRAGVGAHDVDDAALAAECYRRALRLDADLYAAQVNLSWLLFQHDRARALRSLEAVVSRLVGPAKTGERGGHDDPDWQALLAALERVATGLEASPRKVGELTSFERNPWYYQARYGLLSLYVEALLDARGDLLAEREHGEVFRRSRAEANRLPRELETAAAKLARLGASSAGSPSSTARHAEKDLRRVALLAQPVLLSLEVLTGEITPEAVPEETEERIRGMRERALLDADGTFAYNVACLLSLYCMRRGLESGTEIEAAVRCLEIAASSARYRAEATTDPALLHLSRTEGYRKKFGTQDAAEEPDALARLTARWQRLRREKEPAARPSS